MTQIVHESGAPGIEFDTLHIVQDFGHEPCSGVLVLHLSDLKGLHDPGDESVNGYHDEHGANASKHAKAH